MEGHPLLYTDSVQLQFHLFDYQKCNFTCLLWCGDITIPVNTPFPQSASCLFKIYTGSHCDAHPLPEDSGAVTSFTGLTHKLTLVHTVTIDAWCTVPSSEPCMWESSQAIVRWVCTCGVVPEEPSAETGLWWNLGSAYPCELMKPRTQKSSCLKSMQLLAGLHWKTKRGQICWKSWVLCVVVMEIPLSHVIFTLCCTHVPPIILYHTVKYNLLHIK